VEVKHRGTLPSRHDVEGFRATITAFLVDAAPRLFGIEFDSISLSALVRSDEVRSALQAAEAAAREEKFPAALEHSARAFRLSLRLHRYGENPRTYNRRLFDPTDVSSDLKWRGSEIGGSGRSRLLDAVADMGQSLGEAITVLAYNLDYDGYRHIRTYGPIIHEIEGGQAIVEWMAEPTTDRRIVDRCVSFAVDAALRLEGRADPADPA
jgi:hypothetical protein